jgi:RNA polymerase sigma-70 factor (ECF subfamily)
MAIAVDELFERHALTVYRYLRRMTGRPDLAEDLTQDVFLRVLRGRDRYEARDREISWVLRITRNVLLDHWHRTRTNIPPEVPVADVEEPSSEPNHVLALGFQEALRLLPRSEREVYLLKERSGLTYEEIASACGMTVGAVRSKLYRARRQIKRLLATRLSADGQELE